jgi:uncharacterized membrane-anchored protein
MRRYFVSSDDKIEAGLFGLGGGIAGAVVSSQLGGMGLAVAGTAVGIGAIPVIAVGTVAGLAIYGVKKAFFSDHQTDSSQEKQKE